MEVSEDHGGHGEVIHLRLRDSWRRRARRGGIGSGDGHTRRRRRAGGREGGSGSVGQRKRVLESSYWALGMVMLLGFDFD
jgi:hypothetical protein